MLPARCRCRVIGFRGDFSRRCRRSRIHVGAAVVIAQCAVDGKTNEIPMFATTLDQVDHLTDVLVTADAMHAQREHATYLHRRGAHYLLTVKANQPRLREQLRALPWKDVPI